jgi:hypothetical protein
LVDANWPREFKPNMFRVRLEGNAFGRERRCRWKMHGAWRVYVEHDNNVRLNCAIGYITPKDMLAGHQQEIQAERNRSWTRRRNSGRIAARGRRGG